MDRRKVTSDLWWKHGLVYCLDIEPYQDSADDGGMRVIVDLVVNHTSKDHPWFKAARSSRDSPYHDWYVWRDEKPREKPGDIVFPDQENSNWTYDRTVRQW